MAPNCLTILLLLLLVATTRDASSASAKIEAPAAPVKVNRTIPQVAPPKGGLEFSANPSILEIFRARVFEEPLVPVGGEPTLGENTALAAALISYSKRSSPDDFSSLTGFLDKHPRSPWRAALLTDLGIEYYNTAHYSRALDAWERAWALAKDVTDAKGKSIADRALGELAYMLGRVGQMTELEPLLKSIEGRVIVGSATERISGIRQALWNMQNRPEVAFRCGPLALKCILQSDPERLKSAPPNATMEIFNSASTQKGFSLPQVMELSKRVGLNFQMAFREKGGEYVVPAVVHWKVGHYAALVRKDGDKYLLQDPTFGNETWASREALDAETSGYFLMPPGNLPAGWRAVDESEGSLVWGKGQTSGNDPGPSGPPCSNSCGCDGLGGIAGSSGTGGARGFGSGGLGGMAGSAGAGGVRGFGSGFSDGLGGNGRGMAVSSVMRMVVSLNLYDEPVGYSPPVGPAVQFALAYSHRDAFQPANFTYSNFGPKWTCYWVSYITDNPLSLSADVKFYMRGGGTRTFTGFNVGTQMFAHEQYDQTLLKRAGASSYELLYPDGSKLIFGQSDGSVGSSRKIFLTQVVDPFGNAVVIGYDSNSRIIAITDAIGQVTTLTYGLTNDIYKVTRVTDPFGRYASFDYDFTNRLAKITDVIGLTSEFTYEGAGDFVNSLITPYGTNTFTRGEVGTTRWLETHYPDGSRDRVEYNQNIAIPDSEAAGVPSGMSTLNQYLHYRNTYYWSRTACDSGYGDYSKAKIYHWLHTADLVSSSGILESTKEALEGRVWHDYSGQSFPSIVGNSSRPAHVGRLLDDGTTQLYTYSYDGFGHATNSIDPVGRTFSYIYSTNGIDLLEVRQTRGTNSELLAKMTYNAQHLPLTRTDAAGQTTTNTYNARGQLLTRANPKGETTSFTYDTNGYLTAVDGPLPGTNDTTTASYDAVGRVKTKTDVSGYTVTLDHDDMDRVTKVTHPDGTFEQFTYDRLDTTVIRDRAGRQTFLEFDSMQQLVKRTDPLNRVTHFQWCSCGDLKSLTDPMGRTTTWNKDVQGRFVSKQYGDGSLMTYFYENSSSRVRQVIDEKNQVTQYTYNPDDTLRTIGYANVPVPTPNVQFTYDPNYMRRASMTDGTGTTLYSYNPITASPALGAGKLASEDGPLLNDSITYGYDELGRQTHRAINGVGFAMTYDQAGRLISETNTLGAFTYAYDGVSRRLLTNTFPNGLTIEREYGGNLEDRELERITHRVGVTPVSEFLYERDHAAHRITRWSQQTASQPPSVYTFGYDTADQLLSASVTNSGLQVNTFSYSYDLLGNRLAEQVGASNYVATYNALNQISATTAPGAARTNEWDGEDRLVAVNAGNQRTEFTYDGASRLASLRVITNGVQASLRRFIWCGNKISEERDVLGNVTKRFTQQGMKVETGGSAGSYYYTRDHLGSIRELVDSTGTVRARYAYDPYGRGTLVTGDVEADFGFANMLRPSAAGLLFSRFRAYDPETGRWTSRDRLKGAEVEEGPNLYAYVGGNSVNAIDPLGLKKQCCELEARFLEARYGDYAQTCEIAQDTAYKACLLAQKQDPKYWKEICEVEIGRAITTCNVSWQFVKDAVYEYSKCANKPCRRRAGVCDLPKIPEVYYLEDLMQAVGAGGG